tara:strand:+ start:496 stop:669 length:174 start_codon:yes stop_codon:yes gene_type:complete
LGTQGAVDHEFRVAVRYASDAGDAGGNQLHAAETSAYWNKQSATYNPGMVYAGAKHS